MGPYLFLSLVVIKQIHPPRQFPSVQVGHGSLDSWRIKMIVTFW